jgi:hypothetical protein
LHTCTKQFYCKNLLEHIIIKHYFENSLGSWHVRMFSDGRNEFLWSTKNSQTWMALKPLLSFKVQSTLTCALITPFLCFRKSIAYCKIMKLIFAMHAMQGSFGCTSILMDFIVLDYTVIY